MSIPGVNAAPRLFYFGRHVAKLMLPRAVHCRRRQSLFESVSRRELDECALRVRYYNKVQSPFELGDAAAALRIWHARDKRNYYLDMLEYTRCFPEHLRFDFRFGDKTFVPAVPSFVKARPIAGDNANAVLFKLNRVRHFHFVEDTTPFAHKLDRLVWRGHAARAHRLQFLEKFIGHERCDVGHVDRHSAHPQWRKPFMSIADQLGFKFILSIEGNDVATNLKWILSSNSLCFMTRPKFETWFMEGTLVPERHYVLLADDYSDLDDKLRFYSRNARAAQAIIDHAHAFVAQFQDARREELVALLVLQRYFELSGQLPPLELGTASAMRRPIASA